VRGCDLCDDRPEANHRHHRLDGNDDIAAQEPGVWTSARAFFRDFLAFAGKRSAVAVLLVASGALLEGLGLVLLVPLLGLVFGTGKNTGWMHRAAEALFAAAGVETPFARLALLIGLFAALLVLRSLVVTRRDVLLAELQIGFLQSRRGEIATLLAQARWDQVVRLRHARIAHLMSGDIQRIGTGVSFMTQSGVAATMLAAQCALAFVLSPALAAVSLVLLAIVGIAILPMIRRAQTLGRFVTNANLTLMNTTAQYLGGLKMAIGQNRQGAFAREFNDTLAQLGRAQVQNMRQNSLSRTGIAMLLALVGAGLVLAGFGLFHVPAPTLIALLLVVARMGGPVTQIQQGVQIFAHALPAYDKVRELAAELAVVPHDAAEGGYLPPAGAIVFEHVWFRYPAEGDGAPAAGVRDLNLRIEAGEFVGIAGPSGAGKTTFADLLVGLLEPQEGRISVGGAALTRAVLPAWGGRIGYVSQDPFLFHDTVRRNLSWANPSASEAEMWSALAIAAADGLVRRMERGLDTVVGERGTLVSGGERQRIALARAILRAPKLLVLDEATNAIDVPTERGILEQVSALTPRPTIVMIAHRPESLALCERVWRLEEGRIVESGTRPARLQAASS